MINDQILACFLSSFLLLGISLLMVGYTIGRYRAMNDTHTPTQPLPPPDPPMADPIDESYHDVNDADWWKTGGTPPWDRE